MPRLARVSTAAAALMIGSALPAFAQEALCGQGAVQWLGGSAETSDIATSEDFFQQLALVLQNGSYLGAFTVSEPTALRVEAAAHNMGDSVLEIYNEAGESVYWDDDSGGNGASRLEAEFAAGTYCAQVTAYDGSPISADIRVGRDEHEPLTAGIVYDDYYDDGDDWGDYSGYNLAACDSSMVQRSLGDGPIDELLEAGVSGSASVSEVAVWGFSLAAPQALTITATNAAADPVMALYNGQGTWLGENDDYNGLDAQLDMMNELPAGDYCLSLSAYNDTSLPVQIRVSRFDAAAAMQVAYDQATASPPMDGSHAVTDLGELGARQRLDLMSSDKAIWHAFTMPTAGLVVIDAITNGGGDPVLSLFDDYGREIAFNDDSNQTLDAQIATRLLPGTYMVALRQYSQGSNPVPTRLILERYVPVE